MEYRVGIEFEPVPLVVILSFFWSFGIKKSLTYLMFCLAL